MHFICTIYADNITSDTVANQVEQRDLWGFSHLIAQANGIALLDNGHPVAPFDEEVYREFIRSHIERECWKWAALGIEVKGNRNIGFYRKPDNAIYRGCKCSSGFVL